MVAGDTVVVVLSKTDAVIGKMSFMSSEGMLVDGRHSESPLKAEFVSYNFENTSWMKSSIMKQENLRFFPPTRFEFCLKSWTTSRSDSLSFLNQI